MRFLVRMLVSAAVIFCVASLTRGYLVPQMPFVTAIVLALVLVTSFFTTILERDEG